MSNSREYDELVDRHRKQDRAQVASDIRVVLETEAGRRLLMAMLFSSGVYAHTKQGDSHDYLAGRKDAMLEIMRDCNDVCPDFVLKARIERHSVISARNAAVRQLLENEQKTRGT